jgi:chemotaxis protein CheX
MNVKFLNPFVEAAHEVLQAETHYIMQRGDLGLEKGAYITPDVTVLIHLVGQVEGLVLYAVEESTALALSSSMMGEKFDNLDSLAQSGIAELGNVITGRASIKLSQAGFESNISPPTLLLGRGAMISTLDFPRLVVPLKGECGLMMIHLALREGRDRGVSAVNIPVPEAPKI